MLHERKISVVIPCKNEQDSIVNTIKSIPAYVDEILVVDNGSTDNTVSNAKKAGATVLIEHRKLRGIGYGFAILKGLKHASGDIIFTIDADGSHPAKDIKKICDYMLKNHIDVVSCSRLPLSNDIAISRFRKFGIHILNIEAFILFGIRIQDMLSGMFGIKKTALKHLDLKMGDWNLSPEIKISASLSKKIKFAEYPIAQIPRTGGVSKQVVWDTGTTHLLYILKRRVLNMKITKIIMAIKKLSGNAKYSFAKVRNTSLQLYPR